MIAALTRNAGFSVIGSPIEGARLTQYVLSGTPKCAPPLPECEVRNAGK